MTEPFADVALAPAVAVRSLTKEFDAGRALPLRLGRGPKAKLRAVDDVSFEITRGETLALVGESGSGKSTVANMVAGLLDPTAGTVELSGVDFYDAGERARRERRRHVQIVFQDPYSSHAPTTTVGASIAEPLIAHRVGDKASRAAAVESLLRSVQLDPKVSSRFPQEMSGGQLQRVSIARALALEPELVVLDEPVSALDVSTKAEILNLLATLKEQRGLSYLFVSHDLSTLRVIADRVAVMYLGRIVEIGAADEIYDDPQHPYTKALLAAVPRPDPSRRPRERVVLGGDVPSPLAIPSGCAFRTRCPVAVERCAGVTPLRSPVGATHEVACHLTDATEGARR